MLLKCLTCGGQLQVSRESCVCPACQTTWPVTGDIPRFFQVPDYYWGEVERSQAQELLAAARTGSWVEAVEERFPPGHEMLIGLLDLQRASWATMLGLNERSVALDVGSGYGAITHSLSRLVGEVYSVEAIPERIGFTSERLRQEGIANVRLIQASATDLPFLSNSFDLVVTNGVLEWVGEWDLTGDARSVQVRFLRSLNEFLKEDGVLVIGIENRIGYNLFLGSNDHSGIPYTSLVPRRIASLMQRLSSARHHRTKLNAKKEYRTYTYSERGYRKLLADAGFESVSCFWADPGYNQPYHLIPLSRPQWVQAYFNDLAEHPSPAPRRSWRRALKRAIASSRLVPLTVPEFVLLACKRRGRTTELQTWIEKSLKEAGHDLSLKDHKAEPIPWSLWTSPFQPKSVVRLGSPKSNNDLAYLHVSIGRDGDGHLQTENVNRAKIQHVLMTQGSGKVRVPQTSGTFRSRNVSYCMESAAGGVEVSRLVRRLGYFDDVRRFEDSFNSIFENLIELTEALRKVPDAATINPEWLEVPHEFGDSPELKNAIEQRRYFGKAAAPAWIQHGDFSVENMSIDAKTHEVTVFDWVDMADGFPPFYDFFQMLYSTGYLPPAEETVRFANDVERWTAIFNAIFFCDTGFSRVAENLLLRACKRFDIQPELMPALLIEYLLIRTHYYKTKSATQRKIHLTLLQTCLEQKRSVFGKFPLCP
jgi:SAM-dependent methyltransferase